MISFARVSKQYGRQVLFVRALSGGEKSRLVMARIHVYRGSYVEYVERTAHEAPGVHA
jgi:hypothetical protein